MKIKKTIINKEKVKAIPIKKTKIENVQGAELIPELNANIFLLAKKNSGKTCTIFKILKKCTNKKTTVVIFASTIYRDPNWQFIIKWLKHHDIPVVYYTSITENGVNRVEQLTDYFKTQKLNDLSDSESEDEKPSYVPMIMVDSDEESEEEEKEIEPKKTAPDYILVFDDMSKQLRDKDLEYLMTMNRHYTTKLIISSQYAHHLSPAQIQQLDIIFLFPGIPKAKLEYIYECTTLNLDPPETDDITNKRKKHNEGFELFYKLYKDATTEKYNFLYCDIRNDKFRHNFDEQLEIEN